MRLPPKEIVLYAAKAVCAGALSFGLAWAFRIPDFPWYLVSVVLVLSPNAKDALPLAITRIEANAAGAAASFFLLLLGLPDPVAVCAAIGLTVLLCHYFRVMAGSRSALAAVVIIMMREPGAHLWLAALERLLSVAAGCLSGLAVTYLFHRALGPLAKAQIGEE
jgi:uncharacterized membrane protein YgaE (UPF0421/DUF939 family)